jgi:hypothetical protein
MRKLGLAISCQRRPENVGEAGCDVRWCSSVRVDDVVKKCEGSKQCL